jgi:hypothetical protein
LTSPSAPKDWPSFSSSTANVPADYTALIDSVLLLDRLREVNALIGFTRVEPPEESIAPDECAPRASLSRGKPTWVPASEVHGEGIFITISESALLAWEAKPAVKKRDEMLQAGHQGWRIARKMDPATGYPGIRYAMLHTLSHLLIRELALECGYNAASIRERIYATDQDHAEPMAGILLYTAAADSDGTLGGLVDLGKPETLGHLIKQALRRSGVCSADPLCSEHNPGSDRPFTEPRVTRVASFRKPRARREIGILIERSWCLPSIVLTPAFSHLHPNEHSRPSDRRARAGNPP